jgi:hypothetical protein
VKSYNFNSSISARPLDTARFGTEAGDPYFVEVKKAQWDADPREKTLVIHAQARPGIRLEKAKLVFQHAAVEVFRAPGAPCLLDWYDPAEAPDGKPVLSLISLTLIFFPGTVDREGNAVVDSQAKGFIAARRPETVAREFTAAMRNWQSLLP